MVDERESIWTELTLFIFGALAWCFAMGGFGLGCIAMVHGNIGWGLLIWVASSILSNICIEVACAVMK